MAQYSKIEWTHSTLNLWSGCTKVHEGCDHCYAEALSHRWGNDVWGNDKPRKLTKSAPADLLHFQRTAAQAGKVYRVFVGSMMDIFEKPMPLIDTKGLEVMSEDKPVLTSHLRQRLFEQISQGVYPNLLFLFLTKRETNINKYIPEDWKVNPPSNVMFGASVVNQTTFDRVTENMKAVNGKKFLSIEPQLDFIKLGNLQGIDWIIQGGESGPRKRPFKIEWAYSMRDEAQSLGIPYFFKQIDKIQPVPEDLMIKQFPF